MPAIGRRSDAAVRALQGACTAALAFAGLSALGVGEALGAPLAPALWAAAAAGALAFALGGRLGARAVHVVAGATAALLLLVASAPVALPIASRLVRRDTTSLASVDAVLALSGSQTDAGLVARDGLARLLDAARLARTLDRPLVVSVIHPKPRPEVSSLADQRDLAALVGVRTFLAVDSVHTTHDEAVRMSALARREGWHRVALVTSPLHSRRACATFERTGLVVVCMPSRSRELTLDGPAPLASAGERLRAFGECVHEVIGWWSYRLRGWL
jgi:uncharacterized SAM-binding protein YcdF (DUF218 family)